MDLIDPKRTIFAKRLYRNSCIHTDNGLFIKDLRILNRDLKSIVIADNAVFSFAFQLDNGIPIIPFYDDKEDAILPKITEYLLKLKDEPDVREINKKTFSLSELYALDVPRFIKYYSNDEKEISDDENECNFSPIEIEETEVAKKASPPKVERRKSISFCKILEMDKKSLDELKIRKKAQADVEDQLFKFRTSLPQYLKREKEKTGENNVLVKK